MDAKSIAQRPCFLCPQNRPREQRAIELHDDLVLLCNPFPIFPEHFTIPTLAHRPQRIRGERGDGEAMGAEPLVEVLGVGGDGPGADQVLVPLSLSRANSVKDALVKRGIDAGRVSTVGLGASNPVVPNSDLQDRWKNRRVEFILIK